MLKDNPNISEEIKMSKSDQKITEITEKVAEVR